jgi:hypothetical protein
MNTVHFNLVFAWFVGTSYAKVSRPALKITGNFSRRPAQTSSFQLLRFYIDEESFLRDSSKSERFHLPQHCLQQAFHQRNYLLLASNGSSLIKVHACRKNGEQAGAKGQCHRMLARLPPMTLLSIDSTPCWERFFEILLLSIAHLYSSYLRSLRWMTNSLSAHRSLYVEISALGKIMGSTRSVVSGIPSFTATCGDHVCNDDSL